MEYGIMIVDKKSGFSWIYGHGMYRHDFLPMNSYLPHDSIYTYSSEESAVQSAKRVVNPQAYKKHYVYVVRHYPTATANHEPGWYVEIELTK